MTNQEIAVKIVSLAFNSDTIESSNVRFEGMGETLIVKYKNGTSWWRFMYEPERDRIDAGFYWGQAPTGSQPQSQHIFNVARVIALFMKMK